MINLAELRRVLLEAVQAADADQLAEVIGALEAGKVGAMARLLMPALPAPATKLVGAAEMASILGTPENWVRDKARAGALPCIRCGHYVKFNPAEVLEAVRHMPAPHNGRLCTIDKTQEKRGGKRPGVHRVSKTEEKTATE